MGYKFHNWRFDSANTTDERSVVVREYWVLNSNDDFLPFYFFTQKKKGATEIYRVSNIWFYFTLDSLSYERKQPTSTGEIHWVVTKTMTLLSKRQEIVEPWNLPPYNLRYSSAVSEESAAIFYPGVGDPIFRFGDNDARPFVNTAGVQIEGTVTKGLSQISFSFNVRVDDFDPNLTWAAPGKINDSSIVVCGMRFPARSLQIEKYDAEFCKDSVEYNDNGVDTKITWKFFRIDVALNANPETFNQKFLNVGTHIRSENSLARVWRWSNPVTGLQTFGTYWQYVASGAEDGEAISENMFLTSDGTAISGIDADGRQIPTYRYGSNYAPVNFESLNLPTSGPEQWIVVEDDE